MAEQKVEMWEQTLASALGPSMDQAWGFESESGQTLYGTEQPNTGNIADFSSLSWIE